MATATTVRERHRSQVRRTVCCRCHYPAVSDCFLPAGGACDYPDLRRCAANRLASRLLIICNLTDASFETPVSTVSMFNKNMPSRNCRAHFCWQTALCPSLPLPPPLPLQICRWSPFPFLAHTSPSRSQSGRDGECAPTMRCDALLLFPHTFAAGSGYFGVLG